jgi:hypothetical protein
MTPWPGFRSSQARLSVPDYVCDDAAPMADGTSILHSIGKAGLDTLPDPIRRRVQAIRGKPLPRVVTLDVLDGELDEARRLFDLSEDAARQFLRGFEIAPPPGRPDDPFSDAYRAWVWNLYERISGRQDYSTANESSPFDFDHALSPTRMPPSPRWS